MDVVQRRAWVGGMVVVEGGCGGQSGHITMSVCVCESMWCVFRQPGYITVCAYVCRRELSPSVVSDSLRPHGL